MCLPVLGLSIILGNIKELIGFGNKRRAGFNPLSFLLRESEMFEDIVETVREPLIVLDSDLRILSANRSFYNSFRVKPEETIGNLIY